MKVSSIGAHKYFRCMVTFSKKWNDGERKKELGGGMRGRERRGIMKGKNEGGGEEAREWQCWKGG